jgi:formyltetrahydrofolate deformylase
LVHKLASFLALHNGNILDLDEHVDTEEQHFYARIRWDLNNFMIPRQDIHKTLEPLMSSMSADWNVYFDDHKARIALFCSKTDHCVQEILWRISTGDLNAEVACVISNHELLKDLVNAYQHPFIHTPVTKQTKSEIEEQQKRNIRDYDVDFIVLARYMQVLSADFVDAYKNKIINIHHSFLPAFAGGNPYQQAYDRGVKIIGATSNYVTDELEEGPIIEQDIIRISHRDELSDLIRKGRDLERLVLARALKLHSENRVLVHGRKTVVFE